MPKINHNHNQADRHNNTITLTGCLSGPLKCPDPEPSPALQVTMMMFLIIIMLLMLMLLLMMMTMRLIVTIYGPVGLIMITIMTI